MFTFIDLFAGIGGTRLAFESVGGECVFSSEIDHFARQTYEANFSKIENYDITTHNPEDTPQHDVLLAGFPCQAFSRAGLQRGFNDTRGTLFFNLLEVLRVKRPHMFLLENVKGLLSHDNKRTFNIIQEELIKLGYHLNIQVLDAKYWVPQHRERVYIVGSLFGYPSLVTEPSNPMHTVNDILEENVDKKYTLSDKAWSGMIRHAENHKSKGNGFGYGLVTPQSKYTNTLLSRYYKDGKEILIDQGDSNPRRLTPRECARLMGFPDIFKIPVSNSQAYKQFGNSVVVPVVRDVAEVMYKHLLTFST